MPIKPWLLKPKTSLGIFSGLGEMLDQRQQRQESLEDRVFQKEQRQKEMELLDAKLAATRAPVKSEIHGTTTDPVTGDVYVIYKDGTYDRAKPRNVAVPSATPSPTIGGPGHENDAEEHGAPQDIPQQAPQGLKVGVKTTERASEPLVPVVEDGKIVYRTRAEAAGKEAPRSGGSEDRTLVPVQQEDGSIVYVPRAQAAGQQAPNRAAAGGATKAQRVQALANVSDALDGFERTLGTTGSVIKPSADKSTLQTSYEALQLQMKELFNLGVLNGPDLQLMRRVLNDPSSVSGRVLSGGSAKEQEKRTRAQIAQMRGIIRRYQANLAEGMNALPQGGGRAGGGGSAMSPAKPPGGDPEFDALMAKYGKRP